MLGSFKPKNWIRTGSGTGSPKLVRVRIFTVCEAGPSYGPFSISVLRRNCKLFQGCQPQTCGDVYSIYFVYRFTTYICRWFNGGYIQTWLVLVLYKEENTFKFICVTIVVYKKWLCRFQNLSKILYEVEYGSVGPNGFPQIGNHASGPRYLKPEKVGHQSQSRPRCHARAKFKFKLF